MALASVPNPAFVSPAFLHLIVDTSFGSISSQQIRVLGVQYIVGCSVVIGLDTNAHSVLWECISSNNRGENLEEFIAQYNLSVLNVGSKPTFKSRNGQSIIDVTLFEIKLDGKLLDITADQNNIRNTSSSLFKRLQQMIQPVVSYIFFMTLLLISPYVLKFHIDILRKTLIRTQTSRCDHDLNY